MASEKIKGLTVKIGADTSDFVKGLKSVDKEIRSTQKLADNLQKGLELDYNEENFLESQKQVQKALSTTEEKSKAIRKQMEVLEKGGQIDTDSYRTLQTELAKSENNAIKLKEQLKELDKIKLEQATKQFDKLGNSLENASKKTAILSAAAAGLLVGMGKLAKDAITVGDNIATNSQKFDLSTKSIQQWEYVALQSDVSTETLYKGIKKLNSAFSEQLVGDINDSAKALNDLGININDFNGDTDAALNATVLAISKLGSVAEQTAVANKIFGENIASELIPLFQQGEDAVKSYLVEFEQIGYLSEEQVKALSEADNQLNKVTASFNLAKEQLGIALIPVLQTLADILNEVIVPAIKSIADWFNSLSEPTKKLITILLLLTASISPLLLVFSKVVKSIPVLIGALNKLSFASKLTAIGFTSLAGSLGLAFDLIGNWGEMSAMEKVLKTIALAALTAAAAITIFHASWSLGIAVGVIAAAVIAGIAAISAAAKNIGVDAQFDEGSINENVKSGNYSIPDSSRGSNNNVYNEDNSNYNINIDLNATGTLDYDVKTLADEVIKKIVIAKQSSGR